MGKTIDCFLIGHNEMEFEIYERTIRKMGTVSGAYRDLNLNFIRYNNKPYSVSEIYNVLNYIDNDAAGTHQPFNMGETFSAATAYLGTYLAKRGFTFDYVNSFLDHKKELAEKLNRNNILTIAITTTFYVSVLPILEIIDFIKQHNTTAKIIIGGPFISTQVRNQDSAALKYLFGSTIGADFYVNSSQGEAALVKIIHALKNDLPMDHINNIYYKTNGEYAATPLLREENVLSENMVNWRLFADSVGEYASVRTSISCPFSCSFCGFPEHAGKYQTADVEAVEKELKELDKIKSLKSVHFIDDTFNIPLTRFKEILRMIIKNKFKFRWHSYFRCQYADKETVQLMKESGCDGVFLGIESGNDQILKNMNKAVKAEDYLRGIELLRKYGIVTFGNFIIGFPGETQQTVRDTIDFIEKSGLEFYRTQLWYFEPITPVWKEREKYNIEGESFEWSHGAMDSREACDLIDDIFLSPGKPIWIPQYNFDFDNFWHLVYRGLSVQQVGDFLKNFNDGVREKLREPYRKEASYEVMKRLKEACCGTNTSGGGGHTPGKGEADSHLDAEFDF